MVCKLLQQPHGWQALKTSTKQFSFALSARQRCTDGFLFHTAGSRRVAIGPAAPPPELLAAAAQIPWDEDEEDVEDLIGPAPPEMADELDGVGGDERIVEVARVIRCAVAGSSHTSTMDWHAHHDITVALSGRARACFALHCICTVATICCMMISTQSSLGSQHCILSQLHWQCLPDAVTYSQLLLHCDVHIHWMHNMNTVIMLCTLCNTPNKLCQAFHNPACMHDMTSCMGFCRLLSVVPEGKEADAYDVLGVEPEATSGEIKKRYWRLSLLIHPDKCAHPRANDAFQAVSKVSKDLQVYLPAQLLTIKTFCVY